MRGSTRADNRPARRARGGRRHRRLPPRADQGRRARDARRRRAAPCRRPLLARRLTDPRRGDPSCPAVAGIRRVPERATPRHLHDLAPRWFAARRAGGVHLGPGGRTARVIASRGAQGRQARAGRRAALPRSRGAGGSPSRDDPGARGPPLGARCGAAVGRALPAAAPEPRAGRRRARRRPRARRLVDRPAAPLPLRPSPPGPRPPTGPSSRGGPLDRPRRLARVVHHREVTRRGIARLGAPEVDRPDP